MRRLLARARRAFGGDPWAAALATLLGVVVAACGGATASFTPDGPCTVEGRAAGAYPALEALLPRQIVMASPTTVDSGRNCTPRTLGSLTTHDVGEVRFAGATWDQGEGSATVIAIFEAPPGRPPLQAAWLEEFYEAGARKSTKTENIEVTRSAIGDAGSVYRLDTLNDLSLQTVVVLPGDGRVVVVIAATRVDPDASRAQHEERVRIAVEVAATITPDGSPAASPGPSVTGST